jgi:hypothetical protein
MRHILFIIIVSALTLAAYSQKFEGGVLLGLTASQIDGDNSSGYNKVGLQGGGWVRRMFTYTVGGQMEIMYMQKGALKTRNTGDTAYLKTTLHYIDIPLMAQYIFNETVMIELGIVPEVLMSAKVEDANSPLPINPEYNRFTLGAFAGIGYRFLEVLSLHLRFNYSILPIQAHPSGQKYLLNQGNYSNMLSFAVYYQIGKN